MLRKDFKRKRRTQNAFRRIKRARGMPTRSKFSTKESGYFDTAHASYAIDTTGSVTLLNPIPQGAGSSERVGKKIMMTSIQSRGVSFGGTTATATDGAYMIVYDKRPTGTLPTITEILESATPSSMNKEDNATRFSILKRVDQVYIGSVANTLTVKSAYNADWYKKLKKVQLFNSVGTGAIGDIQSGAIYLVTIGGSVGTAAATLSASFRIRYIDI